MPLASRTAKPKTSAQPTNELIEDDGTFDEEAIVDHAAKTLHRLGLRLPKRPKAKDGSELDPVFPSDLSAVPSDGLGRLLGEFTAMADYATGQLSLLDTRQSITKHNEKFTVAGETLRGKGSSLKLREAEATTGQKTRARSLNHQVRIAEYTLLRTVAESYTNKAKAISREITRRLNQQEREP